MVQAFASGPPSAALRCLSPIILSGAAKRGVRVPFRSCENAQRTTSAGRPNTLPRRDFLGYLGCIVGVHLWPSTARTILAHASLVLLVHGLTGAANAAATDDQRNGTRAASTAPGSGHDTKNADSSNPTVLVAGSVEHGEPLATLLDAMLLAHHQDVRVLRLIERAPVDPTVAPGRTASIELRLDSSAPERWQLHLWRGDRHWVRTLEGGIAQDAAALEAVALIASRAVIALLEEPASPALEQWDTSDESLGSQTEKDRATPNDASAVGPNDSESQPVSAPRDAGARESSQLEDGPPRWAATLGVAGALYAPSRAPQASAMLGLEHRAAGGWVVGLEGELALPITYDGDLGSFELHRSAARLSVGYRAISDHWSMHVAAFGAFERTARQATEPDVGVAGTSDSVAWHAGLGPSIAAAHAFTSFTELGARLSGLWLFSRPRFESAGPATEVLLAPHAFRPRLDLYVALLL